MAIAIALVVGYIIGICVQSYKDKKTIAKILAEFDR